MPAIVDSQSASSKLISDVDRATSYGLYSHNRWVWDWTFFQSFLMHAGVHWFYPPVLGGLDVRRMNIPTYIPQPVTNRVGQYGEVLIALLSRVHPSIQIFPSQLNTEDEFSAKVGRRVIDVLEAECDMEEVRRKRARLLVLTGNAFLLPGVEAVPNLEYVALQDKLYEYGQQIGRMPDGEEKAAMIARGQQMQEAMRNFQQDRKRFYTDVLSPFEIFANLATEDIKDQEIVVAVQSRHYEAVNRAYGTNLTSGSGMGSMQSLRFLNAIPYISNSALGYSGLFGYQENTRDNVYVRRAWKKPTRDFPMGAHYTIVNNQIIDGPHDLIPDDNGDRYIPIIHDKFDPIPKSFFGRSPLVQLFPKQHARNRWESILEMVEMRCGFPIWLETPGTKLNRRVPEPNSVVEVTMVGDKSTLPQRIEGIPLDRGAVMYIQEFDREMADLVNLADVLLGRTQPSGTSNILVENLIQQAMTRFGPILSSISDNTVKWASQMLQLFKMYGTETRVSRAIDDMGQMEIQSFSNADVSGNVHIRIENAGSGMPKLALLDSVRLQSAIQNGLVDLQDPQIRHRILRQMDLGQFDSESNVHYETAVRENQLMKMGQPVPTNSVINDIRFHLPAHIRLANSPSLPPQILQIVLAHIQDHLIQESARQAAMAQPVTPAPTPQP